MKNIGRKIATLALVAIMTLGSVYGFSATAVQASPAIRVTVDGRQVHFPDQQPVNIDGRILVPVRGVFEELGFRVSWIPTDDTVSIGGGRIFGGVLRDVAMISRSDWFAIVMPIGYAGFRVVNQMDFSTPDEFRRSYTMDVPAQIINGRTMIPLRAAVEAIGPGYAVTWDGANNTVVITTPA